MIRFRSRRMAVAAAPDDAALKRLARTRDWPAIVAETDALDRRSRDPALLSARLARADALRRLGRAEDALIAIEGVAARHGHGRASQESLAASLALLGRNEAALVALDRAMALLSDDERKDRVGRRLAGERAEALIRLDRADEAREALIAAIGDAVPSHGEMSILRRTVRDARGLNRLFTVLAPLFSRPDATAVASLFQWSMACRDTGEPALAISAARQRLLKSAQALPFGEKARGTSPNWLAEARIALADLVSDLKRAGEVPFLVSGTFLGYVREGGIIGHDKDIDLGLLTATDTAALRKRIAATGRFLPRPAASDRLIQVEHANGVIVDVFLHWRDGDRILHAGQKGCWWNSAFDLAPATFLDADVMVPADAPRYLEENYGSGWRQPDPEFETFLDTPNIILPGEDHMRWYFFTKLGDFWRAGKIAKIERVWARLQPMIGEDRAVAAAIDQARAEAALGGAQ